MKSDRKKFLHQLAAGTALAALGLGGKALAGHHSGEAGLGNGHLPPLPFADDWDAVRSQFHQGEQVYLNTGTLGLMPKQVLAAVDTRMQLLSIGSYAVDSEVRALVAKMFHAQESEISLTQNTTAGINIVAAGLRLRRGDEVVLTDQEHVGNALPWLNRAKRDGLRIRVLSPASTAAETLERLATLITRRTRVLALPHITCTDGHVLPVKEIADFARGKGIWTCFDGAHGPGMIFPDVAAIGCDFYASSGHKWLCAPAGTGLLYVRGEMLERVEAVMVGAYSDTGWEVSPYRQVIEPLVPTAHRFDYGTRNPALLTGLKAAIQFMEQIGFEKIQQRVAMLAGHLQGKLLERSYVDMLTPVEGVSRGGMIGFKLRGKTLKDLEVSELAKRFRIRLVPESELDSIRISCHIYNNLDDLDGFMAELDRFMMG